VIRAVRNGEHLSFVYRVGRNCHIWTPAYSAFQSPSATCYKKIKTRHGIFFFSTPKSPPPPRPMREKQKATYSLVS
jgi:hypothetical protein